jgi:adenine-specific DNA methylase
MIPKECKRLAEVDFPIAVVSKHSAREKSIRHGHPCTLHLWWARRPLAACRSILLGLLLPDPCDSHCPEEFKNKARELLPKLQVGSKVGSTDKDLQQALLKFIGDFANWDLSSDPTYLQVSRGLVKAAHPEETPLVVDPFAGGGSIPLEALRLGCETFASDLNPVACLILKVMLEDIPRYGPELAEELRRVGKQIKEAAEKELKEFYPDDSDGSKPIAYLWARTVRCESPNCGAEIPLMRSFWLCKKEKRKRALRARVVRSSPPQVEFEIFEPASEKEVPNGTVTRAKATCLCCGAVLPPTRVRAQLSAQRGGADTVFDAKGNRIGGARLLAVVTLKPGVQGRHYRLPIQHDYEAVYKAQKRLKEILDEWERNGRKGLCPVPDEPMDQRDSTTIAGRGYGVKKWGEIFSNRQLLTLTTLSSKAFKMSSDGNHKTPCNVAIALAVDRLANTATSLSRWNIIGEKIEGVFGRQALPMVWDFCEVNPFSEATGAFEGALDWVVRVVDACCNSALLPGQVEISDACQSPLADNSCVMWFTDPPYYNAIAYANLSDFFFVWLKRTLPNYSLLRDPFDPSNILTPKTAEAVQNECCVDEEGKAKDRDFYERKMAKAFAEGRRVLKEDGIGSVVFAHKTTEGWEALLSGMIQGGWTITGSWPISTEMGARLNARETAALAASIHLICRPRTEDIVGDWSEVLRELPKRVGDWMERLQGEGIRGADLVFACIGPALEIFSRYSKVETAEGREVKLPEFLEKVWEVVGRTALGQVLGTAEAKARNSAAGALEEDARLTALFLWTLQSTESGSGNNQKAESEEEDTEADEDEEETTKPQKGKGMSLIFDVVRRFAQPLGIHLEDWEERIIKKEKGVIRLLPVKERAKQLFGEEGAHAVADYIEESALTGPVQLSLLPEEAAVPRIKGRRGGKRGKDVSDETLRARREATTLDRIHAAMLLQASGRSNALRALLKSEQDRSPDFLRLANALSALYPTGSEEKRLLDAMLVAVPR